MIMRQYIFTIFSALLLFSSCADEQLDRFAIDDISVGITQTWEGRYPHFDVKVTNKQGNTTGKVMLRLLYSDQVEEAKIKEIELTGANGNYSYTAKDFPFSFAGDTYNAFAYVEAGNYRINSEMLTMTVPGSNEPEVTSATFVAYDDPGNSYYGIRGDIHLYGSNFSRYLSAHAYDQEIHYMYLDPSSQYEVKLDEFIIHDCTVHFYGENPITIRQLGRRYTFNFDVPGLKIESIDKTVVRLGESITMKVSGMKPDCTYEISDATIVSAENGTIVFKPKTYFEGKKIELREKRLKNRFTQNIMYYYSKVPIIVR